MGWSASDSWGGGADTSGGDDWNSGGDAGDAGVAGVAGGDWGNGDASGMYIISVYALLLSKRRGTQMLDSSANCFVFRLQE